MSRRTTNCFRRWELHLNNPEGEQARGRAPKEACLGYRLQIVADPPDDHDSFAPIEEAIRAIRAGKMVIVADDKDRENEGDLTIAAEKVTPEAINFMARYGRGLVCVAMTPERLDELEIPLMVPQNNSRFETAFCVGIEAKAGTTTGISAADRAATVLAAIDPATKASDLVRPGHVFPLRARPEGVLASSKTSQSRERPVRPLDEAVFDN